MATAVPFYRSRVGVSAWHRQWLKSQATGDNMKVPCGDCTVCCRGALDVPISPLYDDAARYRTHAHATRTDIQLLDQHPDGSCIYLVDNKCSIYDRRPTACRVFDCRTYLLLPPLPEGQKVAAHVRTLSDAAHRKFGFVQKEPDDYTFPERFKPLFQEMALTLLHTQLTLNDLLHQVLLRLAPQALKERVQQDVVKRLRKAGIGVGLEYL